MTISVLSDNKAGHKTAAEHGLSYLAHSYINYNELTLKTISNE